MLWYKESKNQTFLLRSNYWCEELYKQALKVYKEAVSESGMG